MKKILILSLLFLTSCKSFFLSGKESFTYMGVKDTIGYREIPVHVVTTKSGLSTEKLSFIAITDRDTIRIPLLLFYYNKPIYNGIGLDNIKYTVKYIRDEKGFRISIHSVKGNILLKKITDK